MKSLSALLKSIAAAAVLAVGLADAPAAGAQGLHHPSAEALKSGRPGEPASTPAPPTAPVRAGSQSIRDLKSNSIESGPLRPGAAEIKVAKFLLNGRGFRHR